jgi:hypothetical protein
MDDREWERMFVAAPGEPPPPTFGTADIVAASRKAEARRRSAIVVICSLFFVVLAGAGVFRLVAIPNLNGNSAAPAQSGVAGQPGDASGRPPNAAGNQDFPTLSPMQEGDGSGRNGPRAESASGCDKVDRELATALAGELSVPVTAADALPGGVCTTGSRSAAFQVQGGTVSVTLLPPLIGLPPAQQLPGAVQVQRPAVSGGTLVVVSAPPAGSTAAPLAAEVGRIADTLAARL